MGSLQLFHLNIFYLCIVVLFCNTCSKEEATPREIRAHSLLLGGVSHATPVKRANRYCYLCHGAGLVGGKKLEPSCYQCHGKNWLEDDPQVIKAPASHTIQLDDWFHHSDLNNPASTCVNCHGVELKGTETTPSCYLCHDKKW